MLSIDWFYNSDFRKYRRKARTTPGDIMNIITIADTGPADFGVIVIVVAVAVVIFGLILCFREAKK